MRQSGFPDAFQCYRPRHQRIYGAICVTPDDKVLVVRGRRSGKWSFPKGHIEPGESSLQCAMRELLEETGISPIKTHVGFYKLSVGQYYTFEVEESTPSVRDLNEIEDADWVHVNDLYKLECNVDINNFLGRLSRSLKQTRSTEVGD